MELHGSLTENLNAALKSMCRLRGHPVHADTLDYWDKLLAHARGEVRSGRASPEAAKILAVASLALCHLAFSHGVSPRKPHEQSDFCIHYSSVIMFDVQQIQERATVLGSDGVFIGTVESVEAGRIRLARTGLHGEVDDRPYHFLSLVIVDRVDNKVVWLRSKADEVVSFEEGATSYEVG